MSKGIDGPACIYVPYGPGRCTQHDDTIRGSIFSFGAQMVLYHGICTGHPPEDHRRRSENDRGPRGKSRKLRLTRYAVQREQRGGPEGETATDELGCQVDDPHDSRSGGACYADSRRMKWNKTVSGMHSRQIELGGCENYGHHGGWAVVAITFNSNMQPYVRGRVTCRSGAIPKTGGKKHTMSSSPQLQNTDHAFYHRTTTLSYADSISEGSQYLTKLRRTSSF
ncbi:hypothetical protein BC834DRAFT_348 [Gloeopeniophorella convolvens]|nr:hypothetical protein BC834DRAFT_348 [Gloeopeniophorella convolvens]